MQAGPACGLLPWMPLRQQCFGTAPSSGRQEGKEEERQGRSFRAYQLVKRGFGWQYIFLWQYMGRFWVVAGSLPIRGR